VDPQFLSVGADLVIPLGDGGGVVIPSPTPVQVIASLPQCYPTADGGMWCFVPVLNEQPFALEGLSADVTLYSEDGETVARQIAHPPLNLIPSGEAMPLVAYFSPPIPPSAYARARLNTSFPLDFDSQRYLPVEIADREVDISGSGLQATARGQVVFRGGEPSDGLVWVVAIAFGPDKRTVGVRRWEQEAQLIPEVPISFEISLFSLGPAIEQVEILAEARPIDSILQE
jgi:hypothetical protein